MAKILSFPKLAQVIRLFSPGDDSKKETPFNIFDEHEFVMRRCREIEDREKHLREEKERILELRTLNGMEGIR